MRYALTIKGRVQNAGYRTAFYGKWLDDIADAQNEEGCIPDVAPAYWPFYSGNVTWPSAYPIILNMLYNQYGDVRLIDNAGMPVWN